VEVRNVDRVQREDWLAVLGRAAVTGLRFAALPVEGADLNLQHPQPHLLRRRGAAGHARFQVTRVDVVAVGAGRDKQLRVPDRRRGGEVELKVGDAVALQ
jgi:hypothetical protein